MSLRVQTAGTYLLRNAGDILPQNADYTAMAWMRTPTPAVAPQPVFSVGTAAAGESGYLFANHKALLRFGGAAPIAGYGPTVQLLPDTWYHVAIVRSDTTLKQYIDGVLVNQIAADSSGRSAASQMKLGSDDNLQTLPIGDLICYWRGYTSALTPSQIVSERNSQTPFMLTGIYSNSTLASTVDITDTTGNGRHWAIVGTFANNPSDPLIVALQITLPMALTLNGAIVTQDVAIASIAATMAVNAVMGAGAVALLTLPAAMVISGGITLTPVAGLTITGQVRVNGTIIAAQVSYLVLRVGSRTSLRNREAIESPLTQYAQEEIRYAFDASAWLPQPTDLPVPISSACFIERNGTDVTSINMVGGPTLLGSLVVLPALRNLVAGEVYRVECTMQIGSQTYVAFIRVIGQ